MRPILNRLLTVPMLKFLLAGMLLPAVWVAHAASPASVTAPVSVHSLSIGQPHRGETPPGGGERFEAHVPAGYVVQGTFIGDDVALDLIDRHGQPLRRLALGDGVQQSFMWVADSDAQTLIARNLGHHPGRFDLTLTRTWAPVAAPDALTPTYALISPRLLALQRSLADGATTDAFWQTIQQQGAPLVEPLNDHQSLVTFLWRGAHHNVRLFGAPSGNHESLLRLDNSDVWWRSFVVPNTTRLSYRLAPDVPLVQGSAMENRRMILATAQRDPFNPAVFPPTAATAVDRFQGSSALVLPDAVPQPWVQPRPGVASGTLTRTRFTSTLLGNERDLWTYVPAGQAPQALLVVFDASAFLNRVPTPTIIDNLMADGLIPPTAVVLIENASPAARGVELPPNETFAAFLDQELMPWVTAQGLAQPADRTVIAGSSYGGLASAYAGLTNAKWFGQVLSLSGSYWWGQAKGAPGWLTQQYAQSPRQDVNFYIDAGRYEVGRGETPGILQTSRQFGDTLRTKGYSVAQVEHDSGHDYLHWQGSLGCGLVALLNPEQWKALTPCRGNPPA